MLTYPKIRATFFIVFACAIAGYFIFEFPWYYIILLPVLYSILLALGSAFIQFGFFTPSLCKADTKEKIISLTFDDGPDAINTPLILDLLKQHAINATFFVIGKKIEGNETLMRRILEEGHILANHSYSHSYFFDFYSAKKVSKDLIRANDSIKKATGVVPKLFRPPYGVTNPNIAKAINKLHLTSIGWNIRSLDTVIKDSDKLIKRVTSRVKPGSILLFHDTGTNTIETLKELIRFAQKEEYKIIKLDKLLKINVYEEI